MIQLSYDKEVNITYVTIGYENKKSYKTSSPSGKLNIDYDEQGEVVGVEYFGQPADLYLDRNLPLSVRHDLGYFML